MERVRTEAARHELETTTDTLDVVARRCGFGTAETLRRVFQRRVGVAPDSYRRRFRGTTPTTAATTIATTTTSPKRQLEVAPR